VVTVWIASRLLEDERERERAKVLAGWVAICMAKGEWVDPSGVRREVPDVIYELLLEALERGWRLRREGHKFRLYCPCGKGTIRVDGTPRSPEWAARRIRRDMARCPDRHDLDR